MSIKNNIKDPLIFDGAMGTYYASIKEKPLKKCELANIYDKETILDIHKQYIEAGCKAIKTNTFGANKISLESDWDTVREVVVNGYEIALEAAKNTEVLVFADIGPIPFLEGVDLFESYKAIVDLFLKLGAENFIFETFNSDEHLEELSKYIKSKRPHAYILVEFSVSPEGFTRLGIRGKKLFDKFSKVSAVDALGFNCFCGPDHLMKYAKTLEIGEKPVSIMPNAGYPTIVDNRTFFNNNPKYFAEKMLQIAKQGVSILGGCCGTTPEYIRETVEELKVLSSADILPNNAAVQEIGEIKEVKDTRESKVEAQTKEENRKNSLIEKMKSGEKIIAVELDPPIDTEIDFFMKGAKILKEKGVDAITIADCPIARARVDSSLLACKLKRELDITPIPHMTCRDRNINATKALLLGLNIEGVNNVLVVTGDPIPSGQRDEIKAMFSFNSSILAKYITDLNETTFKNPFNICGALNVNAVNFKSQLNLAKRKIENGISMFLTQPVLTNQALENLKLAHEELDAKILGGIIPIVSYRNACFMNNEISGINVSDEIIEAYKDVSKEQAAELAVKISVEYINKMKPYADGYYIITPFKRIDIVSRIIENI